MVTLRWSTSSPTPVDERLVVADDGSAVLDVLRPRAERGLVGRFTGSVSDAELRVLSSAGPDVELDVVRPDASLGEVMVLAGEVADRLRTTPLAAGHFAATIVDQDGDRVVAITVVGRGSRPVALELDVGSCALHVTAGGRPLSWQPMPPLPMGFVSAGGDDLGGVRRRGTVEPGVLGAITVLLGLPDVADGVDARLVGRWWLPGAEDPEEFEVLTG